MRRAVEDLSCEMPVWQVEHVHSVTLADLFSDLVQEDIEVILPPVFGQEKRQHGEIDRRVLFREFDVPERPDQGIQQPRELHQGAVPTDDKLFVPGRVPERRAGDDRVPVKEKIKVPDMEVIERVERFDHGKEVLFPSLVAKEVEQRRQIFVGRLPEAQRVFRRLDLCPRAENIGFQIGHVAALDEARGLFKHFFGARVVGQHAEEIEVDIVPLKLPDDPRADPRAAGIVGVLFQPANIRRPARFPADIHLADQLGAGRDHDPVFFGGEHAGFAGLFHVRRVGVGAPGIEQVDPAVARRGVEDPRDLYPVFGSGFKFGHNDPPVVNSGYRNERRDRHQHRADHHDREQRRLPGHPPEQKRLHGILHGVQIGGKNDQEEEQREHPGADLHVVKDRQREQRRDQGGGQGRDQPREPGRQPEAGAEHVGKREPDRPERREHRPQNEHRTEYLDERNADPVG